MGRYGETAFAYSHDGFPQVQTVVLMAIVSSDDGYNEGGCGDVHWCMQKY